MMQDLVAYHTPMSYAAGAFSTGMFMSLYSFVKFNFIIVTKFSFGPNNILCKIEHIPKHILLNLLFLKCQ